MLMQRTETNIRVTPTNSHKHLLTLLFKEVPVFAQLRERPLPEVKHSVEQRGRKNCPENLKINDPQISKNEGSVFDIFI
jgi:hypothetical protein